MVYTVGLIGGIGTGKTTVSDLFSEKGITIADADIASRTIMEPGQPALDEIASHFGPHLIDADGKLDRAALRTIVFADAGERRWLEHLTVPLILAECQRIIGLSRSPFSILVLSTGRGKSPLIDRLLVVDAPVELQVERAMARDDNSRAQIEAIIAAQISREDRREVADDIINNDQDFNHLKNEVERLFEAYCAKAVITREGS